MSKFDPVSLFLFSLLVSLMAGCANSDNHSINHYHWHQEKGYRWSKLSPDASRHVGFKQLASSKTNIKFRNNLTKDDIFENRHYLNGSGVALGDVDGDGWTDIYFAQLDGPNKLYKNEGGFKFKDITDSAGVAHPNTFSTSAIFADVDGDGDLDLLVGSIASKNILYINDGKGHFKIKQNSGLDEAHGTMSMALADIDSDGDLDLYVANYKRKPVLDLFDVTDLSWQKTVKQKYQKGVDKDYTLKPPYDKQYTIMKRKDRLPVRKEIGRQDELFVNNGDGTFRKITDLKKRFLDSHGNPVGLDQDWGLTAKFQDINRDDLPDLYVCDDYWTKDHMWINQGDGVFKEVDPLAIRNMSFSSMSVDFSDINRDGHWDYFVTEMLSPDHERKLRQYIPDDPYPVYIGDVNNQPQYNRNSLYVNRGDNTFAETSYYSGVEATEWSWASRFLDVDLDGYEDLLVTTGYSYDVQDLDAQDKWRNAMNRGPTKKKSYIDMYPPLELPNKIFKNAGGLKFKDVSKDWGFHEDDIAQGLATADLDHDGDLDLVMNRLNKKAAVYENKTTASRIAVRLKGKAPNTQAIGATVRLTGGPVSQMDEIEDGGEYLSDSDQVLMFAANKDNPDHVLHIDWPDGKQTTIDSLKANRIYEIDEAQIAKKTSDSGENEGTNSTTFKDVSGKIPVGHHEEPYDDFRVQPLLPIKLSQQGPGVSLIDFDSDGDDDLFISSGRGGKLAVFENKGGGQFSRISLGELTQKTSSDLTAILGWAGKDGTRILVGNANYEPANIKLASARNYLLSGHSITKRDSISGIFSTTGPLAAADYDNDGDIDLFVGGRFVPTQYPADATSRLFKNENGTFHLDQTNSRKLKDLGLVTGAVFTDYDGDGDLDLLLSRAWDSLKLYKNENGNFVDVTKQVGLDQYKGWWNGVATGDFNNDGRPDIVATNWGLNSPYQLNTNHPLKMFYRDFNDDRQMDIIESYYDPDMQAYVPRRQLHSYSSISNTFAKGVANNKQFAESSVKEILGPYYKRTPSKEINTLATMVFINEGDHFSAHKLPKAAQLTAAFDAGVADYNNDGNEDIFLSQNFFDVRPNTPRLDAGRGLWLKGDGQGNFTAVPEQTSGIEVYGEQRGAALGDFNEDGRVDLAVSQNGATTKLYENRTTRAGIRVRLRGPAANRDAIGSSLRLVYADGSKGPRREIQTGSGYWSQNSTTQVLGINPDKKPVKIEVRWFDGTKKEVNYESGQKAYSINKID